MNFQPELAAKVMAGEKTVTRRIVSDNPRSPWWREKCSLVVGRPSGYAVCPGRGKNAIGRVVIVSVDSIILDWMTTAEAQREGFADLSAFARAWEAINGSFDIGSDVWRIEFRLQGAA